jgi:AraC-like DNA-binding protein
VRYYEFTPAPGLAQYVDCYWFMSGSGPGPAGTPQVQPIVPDGRMELIVNLADRFKRHHRDGTVERQPVLLLAGQITGCVLVEPGPTVDLVGVRFQPAGAAALLLVPPRGLRDSLIDASLVAPLLVRDIADRLHAAPDMPARLRILNRHFAGVAAAATAPDRAAAVAIEGILACNGRVRIADLATQLGMNRRTLERRFQATAGIGPKLLARIARFQFAFANMQASEPRTWTRVAYRCGYYDQAHMIQEFHDFTGASPSRFFAGQTLLSDFFLTGTDRAPSHL